MAKHHVQDCVTRLTRAPMPPALVKADQLKIVDAMRDIATGRIRWLA